MTRACVWSVALVATLSACGDNLDKADARPGNDVMIDAGRTPVERGRYIMNNLGACTFCHTPLNPDGTRNTNRLFAGWTCADAIPFIDADPAAGVGCLNARNLTNHPTGLMNATDQQIKDAIKIGTRTDGKKMVPIMPYWVFHNMTDDDLDAIVAYLRTVPGVDHTVPPNEAPWNDINDNNTASPICNGGTCTATPINVANIPLPAAGTADMESAMRGRYLSSMAGLCIDCHTPDNPPPAVGAPPPLFPTPVQTNKLWAGGRVFLKDQLGLVDAVYPATITTRNLTSHATGLEGWSVDQIKSAIASGKDRDGNAVCAATHGNIISPYAALDPQDLTDIANYIKSLGPIDNDTGTNCAGPPVP